MTSKPSRIRALAYSGKGYGTLRFNLFKGAARHIENSIREGYYCEAIAVVESVITDRLESRLSYLKGENIGFQTLGSAIQQLKSCETDDTIRAILPELDAWREKRNKALHELVKIEDDQPMLQWPQRIQSLAPTAADGYDLLKKLYHRVADLNPRHWSRAFDCPSKPEQSVA